MELKLVKIKDIKPYVKNPRRNDDAVEAVMKSIKQCEYISPIIIDENNIILAGHTRLKALKKLGRTECECIVKEGLTEAQKKKYRLLDNKTNELATWDFDLLADELDGLDFDDLDLDWGINDGQKKPDIQKKKLTPYTRVHYLISLDINKNDEILDILQKIKELGDIEVDCSLN